MRSFVLICLSLAACAYAQRVPGQTTHDNWPCSHERPLVFCRGQFKYPLYGNYSRRWLDRPLMHDRALLAEDEPYLHINYASFERMVQIARRYELDGFAFFPQNPGMHFISEGRPTSLFDFSDRAHGEGFRLLPEFTTTGDEKVFAQALTEALASRSVIRLKGKVLFTSYVADAFTPARWKEILGKLRQKHGDTFLFLPDLTRLGGRPLHEWIQQFDSGKSLTDDERRALEAYLRSYLDVCDGLYFAETPHLRTRERKFHSAFYRGFIIPLYQRILAEPAYKEKLLGLTAAIGYLLPESGVMTSEDGTKTLRHSLEAAIAARPAVINMPEWDEENENTFIRPTVFNSFSSQRIVRHYMRLLRGKTPEPNPGDDLSIPNLIISYRKQLVLGERLEIEILNVPDSSCQGSCTATVTLRDLNGRLAKTSPPQELPLGELADRTVSMPSENLADHAVLIPCVTVARNGKQQVFADGLHHISLRATWNWDQKWVKQPLRDLCRPTKASFAWADSSAVGDNRRRLVGSIESAEELAFLEVLEDDDVTYAVDPRDEYLRDNPDHEVFVIERRSLRRQRMTGSIAVRNAAARWLGPDVFQHWKRDYHRDGERLFIHSNVDWFVRAVYVAIPRAQIATAVIEVDTDRIKTSVPISKIMRSGIYSETHSDGLSLTLSRLSKHPNVPHRLRRNSADFTISVRPEMATSVFHMRATTSGGKIYFSQPLVLPPMPSEKAVSAQVYSDSAMGPVTVMAHPSRVPDVGYDFNPDNGAVLVTAAGRPFWGILGAYTDSATGRGGADGIGGTPFRFGTRNYPAEAAATAPQWVQEDGVHCLEFDGIGNHLLLPIETLPRRAGFKLRMEIKPLSDMPQTLFFCHGYYVGSLRINLAAGKLSGVYYDQHLKSHRLDPGLSLEIGKWSTVDVIHDLSSIRFSVNGLPSPPIPCPGPGMYQGVSIIGGFGEGGTAPDGSKNTGWFRGRLRALRIMHATNGGD